MATFTTPHIVTPEEVLKAFNRGEDRKSPGHLIPDGFCAVLKNARLTTGVPEKIASWTPFFPNPFRPPDGGNTLFVAQHIVGATRLFFVFTDTGRIYRYDDGALTFVQARRITTGTNAWSSVAFGSTKIINDGVNEPWRIDTNTRIGPLGSKRLAGFEAAETWTAAGGVTDLGADTRTTPIAFVEEAQGRRFGFPAGLTRTVQNITNGPFDLLTSPYSVAPTFASADPGEAQVRYRLFVSQGGANVTNTEIYFGLATPDAASMANIRLFSHAGALAAGENIITVNQSASTTAGTAPTVSASACVLRMTCGGGGTCDATFDDLQFGYVNRPPAAHRFMEAHKSILWLTGLPAIPFRIQFSNPNNPSYSTPTDFLDTFDKQSSDTRIENLALKSFFDTLIVGTRNTVFGVNGSNNLTFTISEQASGQGITDHRSLVSFGDTFLYRYKNAIYAYSISQLQDVSLPEQPFLDAMDLSWNVVALRWIKHRTVLFTTKIIGADAPQLLSYDYGSGQRAWMLWDVPATALFPYINPAGDDLVLSLHTDGRVYLQDQTATLDTPDPAFELQTKWFGASQESVVKKWWRVHFSPYVGAGSSMLASWRVANHPREFESANWSVEEAIGNTALGEGAFIDVGEVGRFLQVRIRHAITDTIGLREALDASDPFFPVLLAGLGGASVPAAAFKFEPPVTAKFFPLARRTF